MRNTTLLIALAGLGLLLLLGRCESVRRDRLQTEIAVRDTLIRRLEVEKKELATELIQTDLALDSAKASVAEARVVYVTRRAIAPRPAGNEPDTASARIIAQQDSAFDAAETLIAAQDSALAAAGQAIQLRDRLLVVSEKEIGLLRSNVLALDQEVRSERRSKVVGALKWAAIAGAAGYVIGRLE